MRIQTKACEGKKHKKRTIAPNGQTTESMPKNIQYSLRAPGLAHLHAALVGETNHEVGVAQLLLVLGTEAQLQRAPVFLEHRLVVVVELAHVADTLVDVGQEQRGFALESLAM